MPMLQARLHLLDWMAQTDGLDVQDPRNRTASGRPSVPKMLRRRLGPMSQMAVAAIEAMAPLPPCRFLFCSRHGEFHRSLGLLEAVARQQPLSPAEFSMSVHNALVGLLSIATGNRAGHTAIAAGKDSLAWGLVEAASCLAADPDQPILLIYHDEVLPPPYDCFDTPGQARLALAVLLGPPSMGETIDLTVEHAIGDPAVPTIAQALDFIRFLSSSETGRRSAGARTRLSWQRAA